MLGSVASVERGDARGDGRVGFVVEHGLGEILAAAADVGEQLDAGAVGGDQVDVEVGGVTVGDVELDVEVADGERVLDGERRGDRRPVVDRPRHVVRRVPVVVEQAEVRDVIVAARAVAVPVQGRAGEVGQAAAGDRKAIAAGRQSARTGFEGGGPSVDVGRGYGKGVDGVVGRFKQPVGAGFAEFPRPGVVHGLRVHLPGETDLERVDDAPRVVSIGRERIDGGDAGWELGAPFDGQRPAQQRPLVARPQVGDFQGPGAQNVRPVEGRKGLQGPIAAGERGLAVGDGRIGFVVENGPREPVAGAAHAREQDDASAVGGDEVGLQVGVVRVGDVEFDLQVGDLARLVDRERREDRRVVRNALGHVGRGVPLDRRVVDRETPYVRRTGVAVDVAQAVPGERVDHFAVARQSIDRVGDRVAVERRGGNHRARVERQVGHVDRLRIDRLREIEDDPAGRRDLHGAFERRGRVDLQGKRVVVEAGLPGADRVGVAGAAQCPFGDRHALRALGGDGRCVEFEAHGAVVDDRGPVGRDPVDHQVGGVERERIERVRELDGELDRRRDGGRPVGGRAGGNAEREGFQRVPGVEPPARGDLPVERSDRVDAVEDRGANLGDARRGDRRPGQGGHAGHVRRGHARSAVGAVLAAGERAVDAHPRRPQVDRRRAVVGEGGQAVAFIGGGDRQDVRQIVARRVVGHVVVIDRFVARGRDEQHALVAARPDGVVERLAVRPASPTVVGHADVDPILGSHHRRVIEGLDRGAGEAVSFGVEELQGHDRGVPVDAGDSVTVVAHGGDRAGDVRPVAVVVHGIAVAVDEVVPVDVVDQPVAVVVDAVRRHFAGVGPGVGGQIGVGVVDARVDHGHDDAGAARGDVPRFGRVDVGVGRAPGLARVVEPPERVEVVVAGHRVVGQRRIEFGVGDVGIAVEPGFDGARVGVVLGLEKDHALEAQAAEDRRVEGIRLEQARGARHALGQARAFAGQLNDPQVRRAGDRFVPPPTALDRRFGGRLQGAHHRFGFLDGHKLLKPRRVDGRRRAG